VTIANFQVDGSLIEHVRARDFDFVYHDNIVVFQDTELCYCIISLNHVCHIDRRVEDIDRWLLSKL